MTRAVRHPGQDGVAKCSPSLADLTTPARLVPNSAQKSGGKAPMPPNKYGVRRFTAALFFVLSDNPQKQKRRQSAALQKCGIEMPRRLVEHLVQCHEV
jgi:hypothetical protein